MFQCHSPKSYHPPLSAPPAPNNTYSLPLFFFFVSMPFSQIIPPSPPPPPQSKRLFYTSVSLLLSRIQGYHYHLSKLHIYDLVYCIGVFLSGLLHSVL